MVKMERYVNELYRKNRIEDLEKLNKHNADVFAMLCGRVMLMLKSDGKERTEREEWLRRFCAGRENKVEGKVMEYCVFCYKNKLSRNVEVR